MKYLLSYKLPTHYIIHLKVQLYYSSMYKEEITIWTLIQWYMHARMLQSKLTNFRPEKHNGRLNGLLLYLENLRMKCILHCVYTSTGEKNYGC